jgi:shikimate kinase
MSCEKVLIAGFSGAGKSAFMRELEFSAPDPQWHFSDLDQLVLAAHPAPNLAMLINQHGWDKFRLWERQTLEGWLKDSGPGVLALGGGTLSPMLLELYRPIKKIRLCYLHASFADCWERLHLQGSEVRPLVKLGSQELHRIYQERQKIFQQLTWKIENPKGQDLSALARQFWKSVLPS